MLDLFYCLVIGLIGWAINKHLSEVVAELRAIRDNIASLYDDDFGSDDDDGDEGDDPEPEEPPEMIGVVLSNGKIVYSTVGMPSTAIH